MQALGWTLLHFVWQGALIGLAAFLAAGGAVGTCIDPICDWRCHAQRDVAFARGHILVRSRQAPHTDGDSALPSSHRQPRSADPP